MEDNVRQAVPFFMVRNIAVSVRFYENGLGFRMANRWLVDGELRWCLLERGGASLMLQQWHEEHLPETRAGIGVSICILCDDAIALWREFGARGIEAARPFVGNRLWVTSLTDPDGYRLDFESPTDAPEESVYEGD